MRKSLWILVFGLWSLVFSGGVANGQNAPLFLGVLDTTTVVSNDTFLLDSFPAYAGYALRLIKANHIDSAAIRVRRSSDNAEQDIGFTSEGYLDTVSLKTFVGANSAYVVKWYDQSGNENDATQSTASAQPIIVSSGVVERFNGDPTMRSYSSVALDTDVPFNGDKWIFGVCKVETSASSFPAFVGSKDLSLARYIIFRNGASEKALDQFYSSDFAIRTNNFQYTSNTPYVISSSKANSSGTNYIYLNGSELSYLSRASRPDYTSTVQLFNAGDHSSFWGISSPLILLYTSDQSSNRSTIESKINNQYQIY